MEFTEKRFNEVKTNLKSFRETRHVLKAFKFLLVTAGRKKNSWHWKRYPILIFRYFSSFSWKKNKAEEPKLNRNCLPSASICRKSKTIKLYKTSFNHSPYFLSPEWCMDSTKKMFGEFALTCFAKLHALDIKKLFSKKLSSWDFSTKPPPPPPPQTQQCSPKLYPYLKMFPVRKFENEKQHQLVPNPIEHNDENFSEMLFLGASDSQLSKKQFDISSQKQFW